jgi:hypothetical protein
MLQKSITVAHFLYWVILPWLAVRSSSIIVALTPYPRAKGTWQKIATVLQIFATTEHRDSPGTYKMPFKRGKPPVGTRLELPSDTTGAGKLPLLFFLTTSTVALGVGMTIALTGCSGVPATDDGGIDAAAVDQRSGN